MARADNTEHLVPAGPGNSRAVRHGLFSGDGRVLEPRVQAMTDQLMAAPQMTGYDRWAAEGLARLMVRIEVIEEQLDSARSDRNRKTMLDFLLRADRNYRDWLKELGLTPRSRAEFARDLAEGQSLMAGVARRQAEREARRQAGER